jgi:predicted transcriptional regulator
MESSNLKPVDYMSESDQKFRTRLLVNMTDISKEMAQHPVRMMDIGYMVAEAEDNYDRKKFNFEKIQLTLARQVREKCKINKIKLTEAQIQERIVVHTDYEKANDQFLDAKKLLNQVKVKYKAMAEKGEMLRSIALIKKKELQAGINSAVKQGDSHE